MILIWEAILVVALVLGLLKIIGFVVSFAVGLAFGIYEGFKLSYKRERNARYLRGLPKGFVYEGKKV